MLIDSFERKISYLRVSVTDRCDFRCTYCMSEDMEFLPKKNVLSLDLGYSFRHDMPVAKLIIDL